MGVPHWLSKLRVQLGSKRRTLLDQDRREFRVEPRQVGRQRQRGWVVTAVSHLCPILLVLLAFVRDSFFEALECPVDPNGHGVGTYVERGRDLTVIQARSIPERKNLLVRPSQHLRSVQAAPGSAPASLPALPERESAPPGRGHDLGRREVSHGASRTGDGPSRRSARCGEATCAEPPAWRRSDEWT